MRDGEAPGPVTRQGGPVTPLSLALAPLRNRVYVPFVRLPEGRRVELPGRGSTYVTDTPGPDPHSPTVVLLHALGCTGLLTWFPALPALSTRFRVITLDQRWHGQGIRSGDFSLHEAADDVAALLDVLEVERALVVGYSMGGVIAQRVWRQHPRRVAGLVLAATTDRFQLTPLERTFFTGMGTGMAALRGVSATAAGRRMAAVAAAPLEPSGIEAWALAELRSTSPWAVGQALAALGRHHSRPWLGRIDAPTAVVVTTRDKVIPPARQVGLARAIPGATLHDVDAGHAACVLASERFVPALMEATTTVAARARDFHAR